MACELPTIHPESSRLLDSSDESEHGGPLGLHLVKRVGEIYDKGNIASWTYRPQAHVLDSTGIGRGDFQSVCNRTIQSSML